MRHAELCSIAHNFADSLACGLGLVIGHYPTDVFREAGNSSNGHITVDFLTGTILEGRPSTGLAQAIALYSEALPAFCEKHGASISDFRELAVRYSGGQPDRRFVVTVVDGQGRRSSSEYGGHGERLMVLDPLGRRRPKVSDGP
ncbi:hypothetical protein [Mesorhizobium sp. CN2-181]|uniref:hypothetical protein n=1 Tax=Mesorhizobium yinganensis TaxID=3157707 RepID=UPI0032B7F072